MTATEMIQNLFLRSGATWVLWVLVVLSLATAVIAVERWLYYRGADGDLRTLAERLDEYLNSGRVAETIDDLKRSRSVAASIAAAGLRLAPRGAAAVDRAMKSALALERGRLERRLAFLGTVGTNAPFIGLFGTVIGVIHAFEELGHAAPGHGASAAGQVASQAVMSSIAEALVATAVGILVALPAIAANNYLQRRVASLLASSEVLSELVMAYLVETKPSHRSTSTPEAA